MEEREELAHTTLILTKDISLKVKETLEEIYDALKEEYRECREIMESNDE